MKMWKSSKHSRVGGSMYVCVIFSCTVCSCYLQVQCSTFTRTISRYLSHHPPNASFSSSNNKPLSLLHSPPSSFSPSNNKPMSLTLSHSPRTFHPKGNKPISLSPSYVSAQEQCTSSWWNSLPRHLQSHTLSRRSLYISFSCSPS